LKRGHVFRICPALLTIFVMVGSLARAEVVNFAKNPDFDERAVNGNGPAEYEINGDVEYRYLGDRRDSSVWGVALESNGRAGSVSQTIHGINSAEGRWFRFTFRGLPQDGFAVGQEDLSMRVEYFGDGGRTAYDGKNKSIYPQVEQDRRDFTVNGDRHVGGAAVWRTYQLDFWLPFPQVDTVKLSVNFGHGAAMNSLNSEFFVSAFSLTRLEDPPTGIAANDQRTTDLYPTGKLIPLGGRWYYEAKDEETNPPEVFNEQNADRLLYHDAKWQAPFEGNMSAWLRAGDKDPSGNVALQDVFVPDNVTIHFEGDAMVVHTMSLPNHPTGKFPEAGFGPQSNPNYIQEKARTYFIPLNPKVNPRHIFTTMDNSNHALPMGPIGIAVNGVVFFNPFDAQSQDASNMMDRCCGHPAPDGTYHYHKYPICVNSPWADEGKEHSPLIGFAFDGFPIYGPFESAGVMAKDLGGANALNDFNLHWDAERGWHYHATPGKFPYIIGGYWGTEDSRDKQMRGPGGGGRGMGGGGGPGGPGGGPGGFGPPPDGFGPPP
jgi:hypothetical protein